MLQRLLFGCFIQITAILWLACQTSTTSSPSSLATNASTNFGCHNDQIGRFTDVERKAKTKGFVKGIDIEHLIADPTLDEIEQALADINQRDRSIKNLVEEDTFTVLLGTHKATTRIISHEVNGNKHYGGIITPETDQMDRLPVLVYLEGFNQRDPSVWINQNDLLLTHLDKNYWHQFIIVIPSFRGQTLYFNDSTNNTIAFKSEGNRNDAFDGAAEDALGLLNIALETVENADKNRILAMGGSRGGTVGLLMAQRDSRIRWVLNFVSPLDFIGRTLFQRTLDINLLESAINSQYQVPTDLGEQYVYFFLEGLKNGAESMETVRKKIIQSSPYYFASNLAKVQMQLHFGTKDISFIQLQRFNERLQELGLQCPQYEVYLYPSRDHDLVGDKPVEDRVLQFIKRLLESNH